MIRREKIVILFFLVAYFANVRADDQKPKDHDSGSAEFNSKNSCTYENKSFSIGSKIQFSYTVPLSGLLAQEVLECFEPKKEKVELGAYWKATLVSCKDPSTGKGVGCF
jgi:hypothetical protein